MKPQSAKAKGRRFQQYVRDRVLAWFPTLEPDDVRSTSMGASGADLLLSPAAQRVFPYYVECKNVEALNIHKALAQAEAGRMASTNANSYIAAIVAFRRNNSPDNYVALPLEIFMALVRSRGFGNA